jgi:hypothetical protein
MLLYNRGKNDFEIIIIDDGSREDQRITDIPGMFPDLHIIFIRIDPKDKHHINPVIPYNIAFNYIKGDIVLYSQTELLHAGDILGVVRANSSKGTHLTFAVYSVNQYIQNRINRLQSFDYNSISRVLGPRVGYKEVWTDGDTCWYNHSMHRRAFGSFIWSMTRYDLERMNGFDERYAFGFAFDDAEFTIRLARADMFIRYSDMPYVIHQYHIPSDYQKNAIQYVKNREIYHNFTIVEEGYKAMHNTFYKKT